MTRIPPFQLAQPKGMIGPRKPAVGVLNSAAASPDFRLAGLADRLAGEIGDMPPKQLEPHRSSPCFSKDIKQERHPMQNPDRGQQLGQKSSPESGQDFGQGSAQSASTGGMRSQLKSDAEQLTTSAGNRLHAELDARKGTAATQARSVSSAIGQAANGLDDGAPQWLRSAFQQGAQKAQLFADSLEQKDSRQIISELQNIARANPGAFIAGCAALGFAAARIFKAGAPDDSSSFQSRTAQLPPLQGQEPTLRPSAGGTTAAAKTSGEFV